jgi:hypothetical protein
MPFDFDDDDAHPAEQLDGPVVAVRARIGRADFSVRDGPHRFGGPLALDVRGVPGKPPLLHRVLTLSARDPRLGFSIDGVTDLPLVYGFVFDGCRLTYRVTGDAGIEMVGMSPRSPMAGWPYPKYPAAFPEKRFGLRDDGAIEPDQVHQLTWQNVAGIDPADGVVVIVPPSERYGVSLWGEDGDASLVQVIFEVDPAARTVSAYNQCG